MMLLWSVWMLNERFGALKVLSLVGIAISLGVFACNQSEDQTQTAQLLYRSLYTPCGRTMVETGFLEDVDYTHTGYEQDSRLAMLDAGTRFYSSATCQFSGLDPAPQSERLGISPYQRSGNNPLKNVDPDGRQFGPALARVIARARAFYQQQHLERFRRERQSTLKKSLVLDGVGEGRKLFQDLYAKVAGDSAVREGKVFLFGVYHLYEEASVVSDIRWYIGRQKQLADWRWLDPADLVIRFHTGAGPVTKFFGLRLAWTHLLQHREGKNIITASLRGKIVEEQLQGGIEEKLRDRTVEEQLRYYSSPLEQKAYHSAAAPIDSLYEAVFGNVPVDSVYKAHYQRLLFFGLKGGGALPLNDPEPEE